MPTKKLRLVQKLDLRKLTPDDIEYFCISDDIDREVVTRRGNTYNEDLAFNALYFIVTVDRRIAVLPNFQFDPWRMENEVGPLQEKSEAAQEAIDWFIEEIHGIKKLG